MTLFDSSVWDLSEKPIPNREHLRAQKSAYRTLPIQTSHKRHNEELEDIRAHLAGENHYGVMNKPPVPHAIEQLWVRKSLVALLVAVDQFLRQQGSIYLFIKDGWRPAALQRNRYEYNLKGLQTKHPDWTETQLKKHMDDWVAWVPETEEDLYRSPPPHTTGGAIDLILKDALSHEPLPIGNGADRMMYPDYFEHEAIRRELSPEEKTMQKNRRILFWAMTRSGFACNPTEYWHFSLGDQLWALVTEQEAHYGYRPTAT